MLPSQFKFIHHYIYIFGLIVLSVGLPFSLFLMSASQFILIGNWILEGNYKNKLLKYYNNKEALLISGIFLLLIPGIFYSENTQEAIKIAKINLPFLLLPFIFSSTNKLEKEEFNFIILIHILSVFTAMVSCAALGLPLWLNGSLSDIRQISIFISHIRFSMMITFSIFIGIWFLKNYFNSINNYFRYSLLFIIISLTIFLFILQSITGIVIFIFITIIYLSKYLFKILSVYRFIGFVLIFAGCSIYLINRANDAFIAYSTPRENSKEICIFKTALGNQYTFDFSVVENGNYVLAYVCEEEIKEAWSKRSKISVNGKDAKGNPIYYTIIRYLNSKGFHKDKLSINLLTEKDIRFIEKGVANANYTGLWGIKMRFYQFLWEFDFYRHGGENASGYTIFMKKEFWQNTIEIIKENPLFGVGTGDARWESQNQYQKNNTWLEKKWQLTAHNYYLYIALIIGIPGLIVFLFCFIKPLFTNRNFKFFPLSLIVIIAAIAMLTEDLFTTQAGVSFVAFFYSLFLFSRPKNE
jgi:hypothetical protein